VGASAAGQRLVRRLLDSGMVHPRPESGTADPSSGSGTADDRSEAGTANPRPGEKCFTSGDVTVVIPVRDRPDELNLTLTHVGPTGAVIVVDDGSSGASTAEVGRSKGAVVRRHDACRGPAAARNSGWRRATTDLIAFVDAECEPSQGWIDSLLRYFSDPCVGAVAPRITTGSTAGLPWPLAAFEVARPTLDRGPMEAPVRPRSRVPFVPTTAIMVRRAALVELGGFDETMLVGEDVDLVWRLVRAGWTVRYVPSVTVSHPSRSTLRAWLRQRFDYGTSAAPLARRHGSAVAPLSVSPWTAASWGLAGAGEPLAGAAVGAVTTALLAPRLRGLHHPWWEAARLAGLGHLYGGRAVADAVRRAWWPLAVLAAIRWRRPRLALALAATVPPLVEWLHERPPLDPATWSVLRLVDDMAYGAGVWAGCWRCRSLAALRPDLTSWPGRRPAVSADEGAASAS